MSRRGAGSALRAPPGHRGGRTPAPAERAFCPGRRAQARAGCVFPRGGAPAAVSVSLLLVLIAGCAPAGGGRAHHLAIAGPFEFTSQEPARDGYVYTRMQVGETLVDVAEDGTLVPGLARSWTASGDGRRWRFLLRDDVTFHDGSPFDAAAAANSLRIAARRSVVLADAPITRIDATGDGALQIDLDAPYALLPATLAHFSTVILAPASYRDDGAVRRLHGTGPYRIRRVDPPHRLVVERFAGWYGPAPAIESASYLTGHRAESRALQVLSGQADLVFTLDPSSLDLLERSAKVRVHERPIPRTLQLKVDAGHPFLNDPRARRALSLAIDRTGLAERVVRAPGTEAGQLLPPMFAHWHLPDVGAPARDLARGRALLAELGWQPGADGVLTRDGERFTLRLTTYADRPELVLLATAVQAQLRELGVDVGVSVENAGSIPLGHADGTLEMALVARNYGSIADPLGVVIADFGGDGGGDWGAMHWDNAVILPLLARLRAETDPASRSDLARRVATVLVEELPVIPLLHYVQHTAVAARVRGFTFDPFERSYRIARMELADP